MEEHIHLFEYLPHFSSYFSDWTFNYPSYLLFLYGYRNCIGFVVLNVLIVLLLLLKLISLEYTICMHIDKSKTKILLKSLIEVSCNVEWMGREVHERPILYRAIYECPLIHWSSVRDIEVILSVDSKATVSLQYMHVQGHALHLQQQHPSP